MTRVCYCLTLCAVAHLLLASGCGPAYLLAYTPIGPSADPDIFEPLAYWPRMHFVVNNLEREGENLTAYYESEVDLFYLQRLQQPAFRSLCALLNTYFQDWDRLVIIERVGHREELWYGYVVLGLTPDGPKAVTNMVANKGWCWDWQSRLEPRRLRVDRKRVQSVFEELDRVKSLTKRTGLIWFEARDWPIFLLHDLKRDGQDFSLGVRGYGAPWARLQAADSVLGWDEISKLLEDADMAVSSECVLFKSPRGYELKRVGDRYATLMAFVWYSITGLENAAILGDADR